MKVTVDIIDALDGILPDSLLDKLEERWVIHHTANVEYNYSPEQPAIIRMDPGNSHPGEPEELEIIIDEQEGGKVSAMIAEATGPLSKKQDLAICAAINRWLRVVAENNIRFLLNDYEPDGY